MAGAGIFSKEVIRGMKGSLVDALQANSQNLADTIMEALGSSRQIPFQMVAEERLGEPLQGTMQRMLESHRSEGVTLIQVRDMRGIPIYSTGEHMDIRNFFKAKLIKSKAWLVWQDGLILVSIMPFNWQGHRIGNLEVHTRLSQLNREFNRTQSFGRSGEIVLCAPDGNVMNCFPSNLHRGVMRLQNQGEKDYLPMVNALLGMTGVGFWHDYRGRLVLAAYQPVRDLGFGMVQKVDVDDIFAPAKLQVIYAFVALLVTSTLFSWLLYRRTNPLVRDLVFAEAYANTILNSVPEAVVTTDDKGGVRSLNLSARRIFGEGFMEKESIFPLFQDVEEQMINGLFDESAHTEGSAKKEDGSFLPYESTIGTVAYEGERLFIYIIRDLTERRQAELRLQESERYLRNLLENLQAGVVVHDRDGSVKYMNRAATRFFGFEDGWHGQHIPDLFMRFFGEDGNAIPHDALPDRKVLADEQAFNDYVIGVKFAGCDQPRWGLVSGFPDFDQHGTVREVIVSFVDITERKNVETALVETGCKLKKLNRLYHVLSRMNAATVRVKIRSELFHDICNILVESGGFRLAWIGLLEDEEIVPVVHAGRDDGYLELLERTGLMALNGPVALMIKTGSPQICQDIENDPRMLPWREEALKRGYRSSAGFPLDLDGRWIGIISVYADQVDFFSEDIMSLLEEIYAAAAFALEHLDHREKRAAAEEQLRQFNADLEFRVERRTRQLEAANAELEAFSYSVSHDLRTPLRHIDGFGEILSRKFADQLDDEAMSYLKRMRNASGRMKGLIEDLLELSRITLREIRKTEVDLSRIASDVIEGFGSGNRNITWKVETGIVALCDGRMLKIAMENLMSNAWKFTSAKSEAIIEFGMFEKDGEKIMYVRDNGVGFDMKYASKLFGAFQRLHKAEEFEGTGIGLATVQRIVRKHGGRIWAEAEPGVGATFYFQL
jgi:PAS domain S-box-containing protein